MTTKLKGSTTYRTAQFETCEPRLMMSASDNSKTEFDLFRYALPLARSPVSMNDVGAIELKKSISDEINLISERDFFRFTPTRTGKVSLSFKADSGMTAELREYDDRGVAQGAASNALMIDVEEGNSTVISVRALGGTGKYSLSFRWTPRTVDLQAVEATVVRNQQIDGEKWYRLRAKHDGDLRAESWIAANSANVTLELYDAEFARIATDDSGIKDDLSVSVEEGETYFVRVAGENPDVKVRLTNLAEAIVDPMTLGSTKLVNYVGIGNGERTPDNPRGINRENIPNDDWTDFYANRCEPLAAMGMRRWALWMPFGSDSIRKQTFENNGIEFQLDTDLRVDQLSRARATGLYDKLCNEFVEATKNFLSAGNGREVIAYLGTVMGAPEWTPDGRTDSNWPLSVPGLRARMDAELAPYIEAGCSLAFDASGLLPEDHWFYEYLQDLKGRGVRCYIEAWPYASTPHLANENGIILTEHLKNYTADNIGLTPTINPADGFNGFLDPLKITGERQVWLVNHEPTGTANFANWYRSIIPTMLSNPMIASIGFYADAYVAEGGSLADLDTDLKLAIN